MNRQSSKLSMGGSDTIEQWRGLTADSVGASFELANSAEMHIQVLGEPSGATVEVQGSNEVTPADSDWSSLPDINGMALLFVDQHSIRHSACTPRWVRPAVIGGDAHTNVRVLIALRRSGK